MDTKDKKEGQWDFDGSCSPKNHPHGSNETFSVGIFQWVAKAHFGSGLKRAKAVARVKGYADRPEHVYDMAKRICDARNAGDLSVPGKKMVVVELV